MLCSPMVRPHKITAPLPIEAPRLTTVGVTSQSASVCSWPPLVARGASDKKIAEELVISILNETKVVDGVKTRVVEERESEDGELVEVSRNYFAISARTGEDLAASGAGNIEDVSRNIAGFTVQNLGPGQSQVGIRGISGGKTDRDVTMTQGTPVILGSLDNVLAEVVEGNALRQGAVTKDARGEVVTG